MVVLGLVTPRIASADSSPRTHDGFYLRLGLGAGTSLSKGTVQGTDEDVSIKGTAIATEIALGGTPTPGLAVGFGIFNATILSPTYEYQGLDLDGGLAQLAEYGVFVDYYPDPHGGLHFQAAPGLAVGAAQEGDCDNPCIGSDYSGTGFGVMLGAGYEGWVADEWSIGGLLRLTYASMTLEPDSAFAADFEGTRLLFPALLVTATFH